MRKIIEQKALRLLKTGYTPQKSKDIKAYSRIYCNELIDILFEIASDEEVFPRDRINAAETILNRAYGKPGNAPDEDEYQDAVNVERLTTSQLTKMLTELKEEEGEGEPIMLEGVKNE